VKIGCKVAQFSRRLENSGVQMQEAPNGKVHVDNAHLPAAELKEDVLFVYIIIAEIPGGSEVQC